MTLIILTSSCTNFYF